MAVPRPLVVNIERLILRVILPCVLIGFAAPFVVLLFYSSPATDDFCKATLSFGAIPQHSVWKITWLYYTQWSPRWFTTFLQSSVMSSVDLLAAYGWLLLAVIVTNLVSLWYFFMAVCRLGRGRSILAAAILYAAWVASITHPTQQLYWLTGTLEYNLSLSTMLVLVALLCQPRPKAWYYLTVTVLSIALPAQHEIAGLFTCAILVGGAIITRLKGLKSEPWYTSLGVVLASLAVLIASPGNSIRAAQEHRHLWDVAHAPHWIGHAFYHSVEWLSVPAILIATCCIVVLTDNDQQTKPVPTIPPAWLAAACLLIMLMIVCESAFVEVATGTWIPPRVEEWLQFVFWLAFVCLVLMGVPELAQVHFSAGTRIGIFVLLGAVTLGSQNFRWAVSDLRGPAQAWWRINTARLRKRGASLHFEAPAEYPHLTMPQLLTADPQCWVNRCLANYLDAEKVVVNNSKEICPY